MTITAEQKTIKKQLFQKRDDIEKIIKTLELTAKYETEASDVLKAGVIELPEPAFDVFAKVYAKTREDGLEKEKCINKALIACHNAGYKPLTPMFKSLSKIVQKAVDSQQTDTAPSKDEVTINDEILVEAMQFIYSKVKFNTEFDVPCLAGYSRDGDTIYIDKDLPQFSGEIDLFPFLVTHEFIEKTLEDKLSMPYDLAHQISLRLEKAVVEAAGLVWETYDKFFETFIKRAEDKDLQNPPPDLDLAPYKDLQDFEKLNEIIDAKDAGKIEEAKGKRFSIV
jgi:hypothetical protein